MAKSYETLVNEVRELIQDSVSPFRYEDQFLVNRLNTALQELGRIRPDAFYELYDRNALNVPEVIAVGVPGADQVLWTTNFQIEMQFYAPIMSYIAGATELTDDEFSLEGRAVALLGQFRNSVLGL